MLIQFVLFIFLLRMIKWHTFIRNCVFGCAAAHSNVGRRCTLHANSIKTKTLIYAKAKRFECIRQPNLDHVELNRKPNASRREREKSKMTINCELAHMSITINCMAEAADHLNIAMRAVVICSMCASIIWSIDCCRLSLEFANFAGEAIEVKGRSMHDHFRCQC